MQKQANGGEPVIEKASPELWDKLIDEMNEGRVITQDDMARFYDEWAKDKYLDETVEANGYPALDVLQRTMEELFPAEKDRDHVTILDVGACTGQSGVRLHEMGFRKVDALDPSAESLRVSAEKGCYRKLYNMFLTSAPSDIPQDSYDVIVLLGVMGPAHIPVAAFSEMIRLVRPGGYIVNLTRADYLTKCKEYVDQWNPAVEGHVTAGRWRVLKDEDYEEHYGGRPGRQHVFQIC